MDGASRSDAGPLGRLPLRRGAVAGAVAYAVGYGLTFAFFWFDDTDQFTTDSTVDAVGWLFYNAQFVNTTSGGGFQLNILLTVGRRTSLLVPEPVWFLVPVLTLAGAGYVAGRGVDGDRSVVDAAVTAGVSVTAGYLPLAVVGVVLFTFEERTLTGTSSTSPDLLAAVLLAGLAYPLVCGSVGGLLNARVDPARRAGLASADRSVLGWSVGFGVVSYLLGYAVAYLFVAVEDHPLFDTIPAVDATGFMFYNMHLANVNTRGDRAVGSEHLLSALAARDGLTVPEPVWYLVPIGLLTAAGYLLVARRSVAEGSTGEAAALGATVSVGYLPMALLGSSVFSSERTDVVGNTLTTTQPEFGAAVVVVGVLFPAVFGALGGVVRGRG